jgi:hypothetical protein
MPEVQFKFGARGARQVSNSVRQVNRDMRELGKATGEAGTTLGLLRDIATATGVNLSSLASSAVRAAEALFEMGKEGASSLAILDRFNTLETGGAVASLEELRAASAGAVPDTTLQRIAILGERSGLTAQQTETLLDSVTRLAGQTGDLDQVAQRTTQALEALQGGEAGALKTLGLLPDAQKLLGDTAKSLGVSTEALSSKFKAQLLAQELTASSLRGDFGPAVSGAQQEFAALDTQVENLKSTMGEFVAETLVSIGVLDGLSGASEDAGEFLDENKELFAKVGEEGAKVAADEFEQLKATLELLSPLLESLGPIIQVLAAFLRGPIVVLTALVKAFILAAEIIGGFFLKALGDVIKAVGEVVEIFDEDLGKSIKSAGRDARDLAKAIEGEAVESWNSLAETVEDGNEVLRDATLGVADLGIKASDLATDVDSATNAYARFLGATGGEPITVELEPSVVRIPTEEEIFPKNERKRTAGAAGADWGRTFWEASTEELNTLISEAGIFGIGLLEEKIDESSNTAARIFWRRFFGEDQIDLVSDELLSLYLRAGGMGGEAFWSAFFSQDLIFPKVALAVDDLGAALNQGIGDLTAFAEAQENFGDSAAEAAKTALDGTKQGIQGAKQAVGLFTEDRMAMAALEGSFQLAEAAAAFAEGFTNPVQFIASAAHLAAAVKYFATAGKGGGAAGGGRGGAAGGGASRARAPRQRERTRERERAPLAPIVQLFVGNRQFGQASLDGLNGLAKNGTNAALDTRLVRASSFFSGL